MPRAAAASVLDDEDEQGPLHRGEDDAGEDRDEDERGRDPVGVRRSRLARQEPCVARKGDGAEAQRHRARSECGKGGPAHAEWHRIEVEQRSRVDLPPDVGPAFDVYVNGVQQQRGVDFDVVGRAIVFRAQLAQEGRLGFWRWLSLFLGVAGTYRRHDTVDIVYDRGGQRAVASLQPTIR